RELSAWSKLRHENILNLLGVSYHRQRLSMVSAWMENGTVIQYTKQNSEINTYTLVSEIRTTGTAYLHEMNVVHGDIKGANVLISSDGRVKLTDFGLTITYHDILQFSTTDPLGGTIRWMAQILKGESHHTPEGDVWALGMVGEWPELRSSSAYENLLT
ncbi:kinase-like protein, partial [Ceratobasidium sp. AG-I]